MKVKTIGAATLGACVLALAGQASAGHLAPIVHQANHLRAEAMHLNEVARNVDNQIRHIQAYHGVNPHGLRKKARVLRNKATSLAWQSNKVAKVAFNKGYHRPNHSHVSCHGHCHH